MKTTKHIIIEKEPGKESIVKEYDSKPLRLSMIYDDNGEFLKRLQITITLIFKLFTIAVLIGSLIAVPFIFYAFIKAIMFYIVTIL